MRIFPPRSHRLAVLALIGTGIAALLQTQHPSFSFLTSARARTADDTPAATPANPVDPVAQPAPAISTTSPTTADERTAEMIHADKNGRHLAPHDTFYMVAYVAVKTDTGVEGFDPGQEVHLVEVRRPTHTLVVSDGHAQVEVSPDQLTNDMNIAAMARQKDQADQAQITAYIQSEKEAYEKFLREAADSTAKDLEKRKQDQQKALAETQAEEQTPVAQVAPAQNAPLSADADFGNGYYGNGGYGYGNPYSYLTDNVVTTEAAAPAAQPAAASAPANAAPAAVPNKVAVPIGGHAGGGRPK